MGSRSNQSATAAFDIGAYSEYPDDCVRKVALDGREAERLAEALVDLADDSTRRRILGERAREHVRTRHAPATSAAGYIAFINKLLGRRSARSGARERATGS